MSDFIHRFVKGTGPVTILALHGTGGTEDDLVPLAQALLPGASVLSPRGHVSEFGAARFFKRLAEGVFDMESLHSETAQLAEFVASASEKYGFNPSEVVAVGFSNGANIAASLLLSSPATLAGAVLLRAMTPFEPAVPPDLQGKPIFLASGDMDTMVPLANIENLKGLFERAGATVTFRLENAGHNLTQANIGAARAFMAANFA
ncbi:alpha/beta hydrolase [bacterium]|nr:MAG: alpha/beta hydrolase [bacterium]